MAIKREKIQPQVIHVRIMAGQPAYTQVVTVSGTEVRRLAGHDFMIEIEAIAFATTDPRVAPP